MQKMKSSKGPVNGWRMGFGSLNTSSYCHWPCQKAFEMYMELAGMSRSSGRFNWGALVGGLAGAPGPCCAGSLWLLQFPHVRHGSPAPAVPCRLCLTLWLPPELLWSPGLGDCVLGNSLSCCASPLLSCSWLSGTLRNAQLPLLLRHLRPVQSYPKSCQCGLACAAAFSASCTTTGFSCKFPGSVKQTCNKYCFYRAQKHRRKPGKQTKAGSCKGQQFKYMIMKYIKG